jgi:hypothetical protein
MDATMHWACDQLYLCVHSMSKMPLPELQSEFSRRLSLDRVTTGVMEVMFLSSCFHLPRVEAMGARFWYFATHLILLKLEGLDRLNSLLWDLVLPQTVIQLEPQEYYLDSLLPPVSVAITIQGRRTPDAATTVIVFSQSCFRVFAQEGIRLFDIDFMQAEADHSMHLRGAERPTPPRKYILEVMGGNWTNPHVYISGVSFSGAGFKAVNLGSLNCNHVFVCGAEVGVYMENVREAKFMGCAPGIESHGKSGFKECDVALSSTDVWQLSLSDLKFESVSVLFNMCVRDAINVRDSETLWCEKMGYLLMPGCRAPAFWNFDVESDTEDLELDKEISSDYFQLIYMGREPCWGGDASMSPA